MTRLCVNAQSVKLRLSGREMMNDNSVCKLGIENPGSGGISSMDNQKINKLPRHWPSDRVSTAENSKQDPCLWVDDPEGYWAGSCGISWTLDSGTPRKNGMNFCPKCGKRLKQKRGAR